MCSDRRRKRAGEKKKQKHRSVLSSAACCELKLCADRVRSRTQERESPERQISVRNLIFRLPLLQLFSYFFLKFKTVRTVVLLKIKLLKKLSFKRWHSPPHGRVALVLPSPSTRVCTDGRTYAEVTTKISRIDRSRNFLTNGASQARCAGFAVKVQTQRWHNHPPPSLRIELNSFLFESQCDKTVLITQ